MTPKPTISGPLLFRADANVAIGTGHVMRCLALAQAWRDAGGSAVFAMAEGTASIRERLLAELCDVVAVPSIADTAEDARQTAALAQELGSCWIVVDGYQFDADHQRILKAGGLKVLFLDDYGHARHYFADLVLNQNVCADAGTYSNREPHTELLLGTRYCLLRREFNAWRGWKREFPRLARRLLVTVGGSDPDNVTLQVIQALQTAALPDLETVVVIGGSNPHLASVQQAVSNAGHGFRLVTNAPNMPELMAWADMAVSGAGSTSWEICSLGLPAVLLCVAQNQKASAECLAERGAALLVTNEGGSARSAMAAAVKDLAVSVSLRERICRIARELVDCNGAIRVTAKIKDEMRVFS
jgi:UDP-2,4-diacetamido-2,4,6-trideoxy-beta-L-altropyranose hydrolase